MDYTPPIFNLRLALLRTQNQDQNKLMKLFYDNTVWKLSKYGVLPGPYSVQILGHFSRSVINTQDPKQHLQQAKRGAKWKSSR